MLSLNEACSYLHHKETAPGSGIRTWESFKFLVQLFGRICRISSRKQETLAVFLKHQPAVDNDWSRTRDGVCDWCRAARWFKGLLVCLHLLHEFQQRNNAFWNVVVGPGAEPVVSDRTMVRVHLMHKGNRIRRKEKDRWRTTGLKCPLRIGAPSLHQLVDEFWTCVPRGWLEGVGY